MSRKALLQTCEQIRDEATAIFYIESAFTFDVSLRNINRVTFWLSSLHFAYAKQTASLSIAFSTGQNPGEDDFAFLECRAPIGSWRREHEALGQTVARSAMSAGISPNRIILPQEFAVPTTEADHERCIGLANQGARAVLDGKSGTGLNATARDWLSGE